MNCGAGRANSCGGERRPSSGSDKKRADRGEASRGCGSMSEPPKDKPVEISGFDLQRRLGAGGMAEVFLAKKRGAEGTYKQLVLKRILPEHAQSRRFRHMFVEEAHLA